MYYAAKIKGQTGITRGTCLDVGTGGGYLSIAPFRITELDFIFLDISPGMPEKAEAHIIEEGLSNRAGTMHADVHRIPLTSDSIDRVISRGPKPFWKDLVAACLGLLPEGRTIPDSEKAESFDGEDECQRRPRRPLPLNSG